MFPLGFLFGLGFDTATEISLFGIAATEAANGSSSLLSVMVFPALFTAGMALVDTLDGVLMVGAYQWAYLNPRRKITYNLIITGLSVVVALVIGLIEVLGLIQEKLDLGGKFWDQVSLLWDHFGDLGFIIVGVFALAWAASWFFSRSPRALRVRAE
jgi:high-affinity nickel-transport protein